MDFSHPQINNLLTNPLNFIHLINEIPLGVIILDTDRRVIALNRTFEALSGYSTSLARGIHCRNILRGAACISDCPVLKIDGDGRAISCKSDMININRQLLPIQITSAPIIDINGKTAGYIETISDMRTSEKLDTKKSLAYSFANIIGRCEQMEKIFQTLPVLAQSDVSVLITGETGTGKDLVAEAMHQTSERTSGTFIKINCGALPETLLESELFGHQKGAFTGAVENKPGRFKLAHNGTIFLTEIGDLPLSLQVKLLTFLDDKIIYPLGSTKGFKVNVRMIAATHRNLEQMVNDKLFRKDLLFRLNVARIHLPPLRKREGDVRLLLDYFFNTYKKKLGADIKGFSKKALTLLLSYKYEGNIRELRNIVEYAVSIANTPTIETVHLPAYLLEEPDYFKQESVDPVPEVENNATVTYAPPNIEEEVSEQGTWGQTEREMILETLIKTRGKKAEAARILGWGRSTLWRKIKHYKLE
ncbi:MAG: PAS domain-containing protein [Desulfobacterales bacterium]|nr:PAS domain-containing protein [Desulfobacterales bacterium]MCP4160694.1 PAS domain-containing protein [Deltaproteobacteria bacterium]